MSNDGPTTLYRLYNADGELIYVGIAERLSTRFQGHENSAWWDEVARIEVKTYRTRLAARRAEIKVIRTHLPKYNACSVANAERDRRGLPRKAKPPRKPASNRRQKIRQKPEDLVKLLRTPCGHSLMSDGRVWIDSASRPGRAMTLEDAWLRYGPRDDRELPEIVYEHETPPVSTAGLGGASRGGWSAERYRKQQWNGDGTAWETRLEEDGKWRTRLVWVHQT